MVVFVLLSSEYPIAEIDCDEQGVAVACNANGEATCAPVAGLITVTFENAGAAHASRKRGIKPTLIRISDLPLHPSSHETACKISLAFESVGRTTPCRCARLPLKQIYSTGNLRILDLKLRERATRVNAGTHE
jgi:hypothetical protein